MNNHSNRWLHMLVYRRYNYGESDEEYTQFGCISLSLTPRDLELILDRFRFAISVACSHPDIRDHSLTYAHKTPGLFRQLSVSDEEEVFVAQYGLQDQDGSWTVELLDEEYVFDARIDLPDATPALAYESISLQLHLDGKQQTAYWFGWSSEAQCYLSSPSFHLSQLQWMYEELTHVS